MNGQDAERTANYVVNDSIVNNYGGDLLQKNNKSTKYVTVYEKLYSKNKIYGDAIFETSTSNRGNTSWNASTSVYLDSIGQQYFVRSANNSDKGLIYFRYSTGQANEVVTFRVVL